MKLQKRKSLMTTVEQYYVPCNCNCSKCSCNNQDANSANGSALIKNETSAERSANN